MKDSKETEKKYKTLCLKYIILKKNTWLVIKYKTPYWEFEYEQLKDKSNLDIK